MFFGSGLLYVPSFSLLRLPERWRRILTEKNARFWARGPTSGLFPAKVKSERSNFFLLTYPVEPTLLENSQNFWKKSIACKKITKNVEIRKNRIFDKIGKIEKKIFFEIFFLESIESTQNYPKNIPVSFFSHRFRVPIFHGYESYW